MDHIAEAALIGQHTLQSIEIAAGALLDQGSPQLDHLPRRRGRRFAGEPLAHDHGNRVLDRRVGAIGDLVVFPSMKAVIEHGREILLDAAHATRADRFDTNLFDRFEHRTRLLTTRHELAMNRRIVAGEPQRDRVGVAAHDGRLALAEPPRGLRQSRFDAGQSRSLGGEGHFDAALASDRAQADADRALEGFGWRFLGRVLRLDIRSHR